MSRREIEQLVDWLASIRPPGDSDIAARRAHFDAIAAGAMPPAETLNPEPATFGTIPCEWTGDAAQAGKGVVLHLHGGGYSIGSAATYRGLAQRLAEVTGCRVLCPDYRLAPEHPFPAGLQDCLAVYRALLDEGYPPGRIALSGDSAGGGMCLALLGEVKAAGLPYPAFSYLMSPWTDMTLSGDSLRSNAGSDPIVSLASATASVARVLGGTTDPTDPRVSPLFAKMEGYPPMLIQAGEKETLLDDSLRLADRARAAGADVEIDVVPEMIHIFPYFHRRLRAGDEALIRAGEEIAKRFG